MPDKVLGETLSFGYGWSISPTASFRNLNEYRTFGFACTESFLWISRGDGGGTGTFELVVSMVVTGREWERGVRDGWVRMLRRSRRKCYDVCNCVSVWLRVRCPWLYYGVIKRIQDVYSLSCYRSKGNAKSSVV